MRSPRGEPAAQAQGLKSALGCLNQARYGIAWGAVGAAMGCYEEALDYAKQRVQFTKPIAGYQLVQAKLVEMATEITKAQLLCLQLGRLKDAGKAHASSRSPSPSATTSTGRSRSPATPATSWAGTAS